MQKLIRPHSIDLTPRQASRRTFLTRFAALGSLTACSALAVGAPAHAKSAEEIEIGVADALDDLFRMNSQFRTLYDRAFGVLVFPEIYEGGFIVTGSYGEGALVVNGLIDSYWSYGSAAVGFQAGGQRMRLALFFMAQHALTGFKRSSGFELGAEAEATVLDAGGEVAVDTTVGRRPIVPVAFARQGLMGGVSIRGGRYERIRR